VQIRNKRQFYELWEAGVLGNRTKIFHTLEEALSSGEPQIGFRELGKTGGGAWTLIKREDEECWNDDVPCLENHNANSWETFHRAVTKEFQLWKAAGRTFIMDNSVPNNHSIMQGEICTTFEGVQSFLAVGYGLPPMRVSIAQGLHKHRGPLETKLLLERYMDPSSRDDLRDLMDMYPDAAIEFTCFDVKVGCFPHRSTIFWEVRNYLWLLCTLGNIIFLS